MCLTWIRIFLLSRIVCLSSGCKRDQTHRKIVCRPRSSKMFMIKANGNPIDREEPQQLGTGTDNITSTGDKTFTIYTPSSAIRDGWESTTDATINTDLQVRWKTLNLPSIQSPFQAAEWANNPCVKLRVVQYFFSIPNESKTKSHVIHSLSNA